MAPLDEALTRRAVRRRREAPVALSSGLAGSGRGWAAGRGVRLPRAASVGSTALLRRRGGLQCEAGEWCDREPEPGLAWCDHHVARARELGVEPATRPGGGA